MNSNIIFKWKDAFLEGWKFTNYKNALKISIFKEKGTHTAYLAISGSSKNEDTAFELRSPAIPVETGKIYILTFRCQLSKRVFAHRGFNGDYETGIIWLSLDNKTIGETPFALLNNEGGRYNDWFVRKIKVTPPENAAKAMIRFGFDLPNLGQGDLVCFADIQFVTLSDSYEPEGEFVSRPFRVLPGKLSVLLKADMPTGTSIQFQVRFATDNNGVPGTWTSFAGMDGTSASYCDHGGAPLRFSVSPVQRWLQYRAVLHTTKFDTTPVLCSVTIDNVNGAIVTDSGWSVPDIVPPEIVWRSPARTGQPECPISFRLCDNTGGTGIKSVEAYLDGEKVELLMDKHSRDKDSQKSMEKFQPSLIPPIKGGRISDSPVGDVLGEGRVSFNSIGNEYILKVNSPLKPLKPDTRLSAWKIENYPNALTVERSPEIITFVNSNESTSSVDTAFRMRSPKIPVIENTQYVLSFYSRHNINLIDIKHRSNISCGIIWRDRNGQEIGAPQRLNFGHAYREWYRDVQKVTSPSGSVLAEICFGWDSPNLNNGEFFSIKDVRLKGPKPKITYEPNLHKVEVKACDLAGNVMQKTWYVLVKKYPEKNTVALRNDGMTLIDNKPFFPIGIYAVQKSKVNNYSFDNAFKELKCAGFNTAHTYMKERNNDFAEFYSTAARYGMKVFVMTSAGHNSTDIETIVRDIAAEVDQPALLSWYLADDTSGYISSKELKNIHEIIKDIDPYHLTSQADTGGGFANSHQRYAGATDIFLPELYPVRNRGKNEIAVLISDMKNVKEELERSGCNQGVWAIIQDFKGWGWERYPTNEELRAMTYLSIIHGANGVIYYTYGGWGENYGAPFDKHVWSNLKKVVGELASLQDVLAGRNITEHCTTLILEGPQKDGLGHPALNTLLKVHQGKNYLFAANSAQQPIRCQFGITTENISEVSVLFEDRTLSVKYDVFVDDFKPYDVHVYLW